MLLLCVAYLSLLSVIQCQFLISDNQLTLPVALQPPPLLSQNAIFPTFPKETFVQQTQPQIQPKQYAHRAVLFNSEQEAKLPPELLNPFYKNPRTAEALAKQSWFDADEKHVTDRESEKIPRDKIYYALKSAGLIRRRRSLRWSPYIYI